MYQQLKRASMALTLSSIGGLLHGNHDKLQRLPGC